MILSFGLRLNLYEEILEDYPDLERDDILAAIEYAAHQTNHMVLQGVGSSWWTISGLKQVLLEAFRAQLPRIVSELEAGSHIVELR
jgi:hypothetical protein